MSLTNVVFANTFWHAQICFKAAMQAHYILIILYLVVIVHIYLYERWNVDLVYVIILLDVKENIEYVSLSYYIPF